MRKSSIEVVEEKLPPGFRFYPRDEELICDYLITKVVLNDSDSTCTAADTTCPALLVPQLIEVDLNKSEPWDIPETACVGGKEWYFYSRRDRKYATGLRTNRATATGYWKATGKDRAVYQNSKLTTRRPSLVGMRKTLVFYRGRAPRGTKSDWVMHEFRLEGSLVQSHKFSSSTKEDWVLCRVFHKDKDNASSSSTDNVVSRNNGCDRELHDHHHVRLHHRSQLLKTPTFSPSLMDDPYTSFTQTQTNNNIVNQNHHHHNSTTTTTTTTTTTSSSLQMPCFSTLSHNQTMSYYYPTLVASSHNTMAANSDDVHSFNKFKSKISSKEDDDDDEFGDDEGNQCLNRNDDDGYISESMWRHRRY